MLAGDLTPAFMIGLCKDLGVILALDLANQVNANAVWCCISWALVLLELQGVVDKTGHLSLNN
ncbi:hypothetical protein O9929_12225 [Vibrio lentus]|nr:hypothetical protein [Vibrio lentus]